MTMADKLDIRNRQRRVTTAEGTTFAVSEYRLVPYAARDLIELMERTTTDASTSAVGV